ncbi:unnamed protein product [Cylindrotheca closterium]|uniref:DOT1 domain-containing protein n=1 Tax=Cylindrotheca closterium TaxID=2856 RepID=A0AAD2FZ69_9STRA|nr:unnamed protein product [Cylindrotheca closterium]
MSKGGISIHGILTLALGHNLLMLLLVLLLSLPFPANSLVHPTTTTTTTKTKTTTTTTTTTTTPIPVPEVSPKRLEQVSNLVSSALGDTTNNTRREQEGEEEDTADHDGPLLLKKSVSSPTTSTSSTSKKEESNKLLKDDRYALARRAALEWETSSEMESYELVYGELSLPVLTTILDAVGVYPGDKFLDIGSGDGALVLGASLLYAGDDDDDDDDEKKNAIAVARGLEIVPGLYERSLKHQEKLSNILKEETGVDGRFLREQQSPVEFHLGDIHKAASSNNAYDSSTLNNILEDSTLVVCFATTWSAGNNNANAEEATTKISLQGRKLPLLSKALQGLPKGARVVIVDGRLDSKDGHEWQGDLKINCPDTAPWSIASLYHKKQE